MAIYRTVNSDTWDDPWFADLEPDAKLLFLYLITNRRSTPCGVFEIMPRAMAFETGLQEQRVKDILPTLEPKIIWWDRIQTVWVRNFYKHQRANTNDKFAIGAARSMHDLPPVVQNALFSAYPELKTAFDTLYSPTPVPPPSHSSGTGDRKRREREEEEKEIYVASDDATQAPLDDEFTMLEMAFRQEYPRRNGKQLNMPKAILACKKVPRKDWRSLITAVMNYAKSRQGPMDPDRFMKADYWRQWVTPATGTFGDKRNGVSSPGDISRTDYPQQGYSWDRKKDGSWKPMERDALTGELPFGLATMAEVRARNKQEEARYLASLNREAVAGGVA